jgi:L-lactate utilization protein LutB
MDNPAEFYWTKRLEELRQALEANGYQAHVATDKAEARRLVLETVLPATGGKTLSWGGSGTFKECGLYPDLLEQPGYQCLDTYDTSASREEILERRRQALLCDVFFTGTNAITESGALVNLDMIGNRVAALAFGPRNVVVLAGRNKVVPDLEEAMLRIKNYAAPVNAARLDKKTPCAKTARCEDCKSPDRICNVWTLTEKSFPKGRITVVLVNEDLGL